MSATGYDGALDQQSDSALQGINFLYTWMPATVFALVIILMILYGRFDRRILPPVLAEMDSRAARAVDDSFTADPDTLPSPRSTT